MFVILIAMSMSDPNVTSDLSALRVSVNFGLSGFVCALIGTAKTAITSSVYASIFMTFIIVPLPVCCLWGSGHWLQPLRVQSRLDIHRGIGSGLYQRSGRDHRLCRARSKLAESNSDLLDNLCLWCVPYQLSNSVNRSEPVL